MHALVDHGQEGMTAGEGREPTLQSDTDALVRVDAVTTGRVAVGRVEVAGPGVRTIGVGDRVLLSGVSSRGRCSFSERVRVPFADTSTCKIPQGATDGEMLTIATFFRRATRP